jgi:hypothetical protein
VGLGVADDDDLHGAGLLWAIGGSAAGCAVYRGPAAARRMRASGSQSG